MQTASLNIRTLKSILWMVAWAMAFSVAMALIKLIGPHVPTAMKVFMRLSFGLTFFLPFAFSDGVKSLKTKRFPFHCLRTGFILCSMFCTYYAYTHLPLAFATSIGFTAPLMTTLLAILLLQDKVGPSTWLALGVGYAGVLIMIRPGFTDFNPAVWIAILANFFASSALISMKKLTHTESPTQIMFYTNTLSVLVTSFVAFFHWQTPTAHEIFLLMLLGSAGVFSQFCSVKAYKHGQPSFLAPFEYLRLVFAIPIGIYVFDEYPDGWSLAGSFIILAASLYNSIKGSQKKRRANASLLKQD